MSVLLNLFGFVVALGPLIVFHEFGHYLVARLFGVKVLRFSVGFGRPVWSRRAGRDGTEWAVSAIPFGGYVKMLDEREGPVAPHELHRTFNRLNVWRRFAIVAAGPVANFVLAVVVYWVLFVHGLPGMTPVVDEAAPGTPAAHARFEAGDLIRRVADRDVRTWDELRWELIGYAVDRRTVPVEVETLAGAIRVRDLDLSSLPSDSLDADFLGLVGFQQYFPPVIGLVAPGSVAEAAGLRVGDRIVAVGDDPIRTWERMVREIKKRPGVSVPVSVLRNGSALTVVVTPVAETQKDGNVIGRIGVGLHRDPDLLASYKTEIRFGPLDAVGAAIRKSWEASVFTVEMMGKMIVGKVSVKNLSGPITIADYAGQSVQLGWVPFLKLVALVSVSLFVLNLMPVPLLDGGHLMYYSVEIIKGSPVSERALEIGQRVGVVLLFSLMAFAIYNDIHRLVSG